MAELVPFLQAWQERLCAELERLDGAARFGRDPWQRAGGGGGLTRMLEGGAVLERAGVAFSHVHGELPEAFARRLPGEGRAFAAAGLSVVLHPLSPMVPATHANLRFIAQGPKAWFGGGSDLTPYYLFDEDAAHFHRTWRDACDRHDPALYPQFKERCDRYFFLPHRGEARGVGGVFFDDLAGELGPSLALVKDLAEAFLPAWLPLAERRRATPYGAAQRAWQELRRGRYVEFNLLHDRGTVFGLETGGRTESILMSMPPRVRWAYDHHPAPGSEEARLIEVLRRPRSWA
ncbi:oxygen-dependent coproporphyrinogen oxidase [Anaeromyxobacter diazotrophicus]|uniref:oxygen-dependent coproporphyrinogen oxidase n=1 Tax=Anaeromyxobacter diazotrophicus TaxID=2590199 RepID=UPI003530B152